MMRALTNAVWAGLCAMALIAPAVCAQQAEQPQSPTPEQPANQSSAPIPAYHSPFASAADNGDGEESPQELTPDTRALSGAQYLSLGNPTTRSYWQPHFDVFATADSNPQETASGNGWSGEGSVSGGVDVHRTSGSNDLTLGYSSGGIFSDQAGVGNGVVQGLNFGDKIGFHRAKLSFFDQLSYLPESSLGFGTLGGVALPGTGTTGLGPGFGTGQSILTGQGQNLENAVATELDTFLTPRSSLTFVGGYSLLHAFGSELLDFNEFSFRGGYNREMTRKDTIAALYTYSGIRYNNFDQSIDVHTMQGSYARRVTGRLAFQVAAGPQVVISHIPISGNTASGGGTGSAPNVTQIYWSLNTALQWQEERTSLGLSYNHGTSGGSAVLAGSLADIVTGSVNRRASRTFSNGLSAGYSRNEGVTIGKSAPPTQTYDYWFAGGTLTHPMGQTMGLTLTYQMQYQTSNATFCIGPTCGTSVIRHLISVGVGWHERPLLF